MTGKELINYILDNNLENEQMFTDGKFLNFMTVTEAAIRFNVGTQTILTQIKLGRLTAIKVGSEYYIKPIQEAKK